MIEDKLSYAERVRLESLAQSIQRHAMRPVSDEQVIETALRYEAFILDANNRGLVNPQTGDVVR